MSDKIKTYLEKKEGEHTHAVVFYLIRDGKVILGRRIKVSNSLGHNLISGIGGKVDPEDEGDVERTLYREFVEEIGTIHEGTVQEEIVCWPAKWERRGTVRFVYPHKPSMDMFVEIFVVTDWQGTPVPTEAMHPTQPFDLENVPYIEMWPDNVLWVPKVLAGQTVNLTVMYDENRNIVDQLWEA